MNLKIISAGAGSGKTFRLTEELTALLKDKKVRPEAIIATTFTKKAAAELQQRVRVKLLEDGFAQEADDINNALIGTVHGMGVKLLRRFAFESGVSPKVEIMNENDAQHFFNLSIAAIITKEDIVQMDTLSRNLSLVDSFNFDWRKEVKNICEIARTNDLNEADLEKSRLKSIESYFKFLPSPSNESLEKWNSTLKTLLETTIQSLENDELDKTKKKDKAIDNFKKILFLLKTNGKISWASWASITKIEGGEKSLELIEDLHKFAQTHTQILEFHEEIKAYINLLFDLSKRAISQYQTYKQRRGWIDYTDMESLINKLLDNPNIKTILKKDLDLLMVDEFQDTSPLQLEIFLKLSEIATQSIWVGDPKQSIYGFRGADPQIMHAIIKENGGIDPRNIQEYSWRSREELVHFTNALFDKAFQMPTSQIVLKPKHKIIADNDSVNSSNEPLSLKNALVHWVLQEETDKKRLSFEWRANAVASSIKTMLEKEDFFFIPKGEKKERLIKAGDIAILCRKRKNCQIVGKALENSGIASAISTSGLMKEKEISLVLAILKYIHNLKDDLSKSEILILSGTLNLEELATDRMNYLSGDKENYWGQEYPIIQKLIEIIPALKGLSSSEILNYIIPALDIFDIVKRFGNIDQATENINQLRAYALQYEDYCNRMHISASLGGFLIWLSNLEKDKIDKKPISTNDQTVRVLTYHSSKGLEWPFVILMDLEENLRNNLWGIHLRFEGDQLDVKNILANRIIQYWPNPYGKQSGKMPLTVAMANSDFANENEIKQRTEEARLLYVGITRARDYLVIPSTPTALSWLNRVANDGDAKIPTLDPNNPKTKFKWKDKHIFTHLESFVYPCLFGQVEQTNSSVHSFTPRKPLTNTYLLSKLDPSSLASSLDKKIKEKWSVFQHEFTFSNHEHKKYSNLVANLIKIYNPSKTQIINKNRVNTCLQNFKFSHLFSTDEVIDHLQDFFSKLPIYQNVYFNYLINLKYKEQSFLGNIDVIFEQNNTHHLLIISKEKSFAKNAKLLSKTISGYIYIMVENYKKIHPDIGEIYVLFPSENYLLLLD